MPAAPDLSLPPKAPTEAYHNESHNCDKIALYTLVDLGTDGIQVLLNVLGNNNDNLRGVCYLPPKYNFDGAPLKDVYDYHLQLGSKKTHHPTLFIVAPHRDYEKHGVLLVGLDTDLKCSVDTCRINASEALLAAVNLMIANTDWEDIKEDELPLPPFASAEEHQRIAHSKEASSQQPHQSSAPAYFFGVYTTAGADMTAIRTLLEPDWREKAPKTHLCESVGSYADYPDAWNQLIKHHPWNCRRNRRLHRQWLICADEKDPQEKGLLLVHIDWDSNVDRNPEDLLEIRLKVDVTTERSVVENAITRLTALVT